MRLLLGNVYSTMKNKLKGSGLGLPGRSKGSSFYMSANRKLSRTGLLTSLSLEVSHLPFSPRPRDPLFKAFRLVR